VFGYRAVQQGALGVAGLQESVTPGLLAAPGAVAVGIVLVNRKPA